MTLERITSYINNGGFRAWLWDYSATAEECASPATEFAFWALRCWPRREAVRA
jgi:hypothetical protein